MGKFTNRDGKIRFYDATTLTPFYLELIFDNGDIDGPMGEPKAEEIVVLDKGKVTPHAHCITGPEDGILAPLDVTFSLLLTDQNYSDYFLDWLEAMQDGTGSPTVNLHPIVTTKGTTKRGGVNTLSFGDLTKLACNIEYLLFQDGGVNNQGWRYAECFFHLDQCKVNVSEESVVINATAKCYGEVKRISAFTTGTDITL